jgi:hypothetical protein
LAHPLVDPVQVRRVDGESARTVLPRCQRHETASVFAQRSSVGTSSIAAIDSSVRESSAVTRLTGIEEVRARVGTVALRVLRGDVERGTAFLVVASRIFVRAGVGVFIDGCFARRVGRAGWRDARGLRAW